MTDAPLYPRAAVTGGPAPADLAGRGEEAEELAERFQALADATRLKALHLLRTRGEMCACELQEVLRVSPSNLSFHLQALRHAGLVKARRQGKWTFYRLVPDGIEQLTASLETLFGGEPPAASSTGCCDEGETPADGE